MSDLWRTLPITILGRVRQRTGFRLPSSRVSDRGFSISGLRDFEIGDSFRAVSRKHLVRTGREVVIERQAEHNALIVVLLDISSSMSVGAAGSKFQAALDLLNCFGAACLWQGNFIKTVVFSDKVEFESPVIGRIERLADLIDEMKNIPRQNRGTDHHDVVNRAMDLAIRSISPADMVCIVSDFLFPGDISEPLRDIGALGEMTDVIAVIVRDRIEEMVPQQSGALRVRDAETGEILFISGITGDDPAVALSKNGIDTCVLFTYQSEEDWYGEMADFFIQRREDQRV